MIEAGTYIEHEKYGKGKVIAVLDLAYEIDFGKRGIYEISKRNEDSLTVIEHNENEIDMDQLEETLIRILNDFSDLSKPVEMGDRWDGGTIVLKPANPNQKAKEIPIETFFHKIVMVRDRLRVLEQNINSNSKLSDEDKVNLQQYITRIYGSLTTFNVLFKNDEDHFVGEKGKEG
ncbi:MAG TPA: hypothetical protein VI112_09530 [Bacteroidia bacterium]